MFIGQNLTLLGANLYFVKVKLFEPIRKRVFVFRVIRNDQ